jgi:hypothetical protein
MSQSSFKASPFPSSLLRTIGDCIRYREGEQPISTAFGLSRLIRLQLRSAGVPTLQTCVVLDTEEIKPKANIIVSLITDVFLLVTVLVAPAHWWQTFIWSWMPPLETGRIGVVPLHCGVLNPLTCSRFLTVSFGS